MKQASFPIHKVTRGKKTTYRIYVPAYLSPTGRKTYHHFRTQADAIRAKSALQASTRTQSKLTVLSNAQITDAQRALERLAEHGLAISLDKAIELALPALMSTGRCITVAQLLRDFGTYKADTWSAASVRAFKTSARTFCARFGERMVSSLDPCELEAWYSVSFGSSGYRAHEIRTIRPAFSWAARRRIITESPYSRMESVRVKRKPIVIYTPEEARAIMESCPADSVAAFALLLFAGVRPKELTRLTWGNIRDGFVHITADIAKTQQTRNIELEANAAAWLASTGTHEQGEKICPANWMRRAREIRTRAGVHSLPDTPRHSYASYHFAAYKDTATLKANLGHTPGSDTLFIHYRAAAVPSDAERYWQIMPQSR